MGDTIFTAKVQKVMNGLRQQPIEGRRAAFKNLMASGWYERQKIDTTLLLALMLGGERGRFMVSASCSLG